MACDKHILLNQEHSYAILLQSMCHGRNGARTFVIKILLQQCNVKQQYVQSGKFFNKMFFSEQKEIWKLYVLTEDKLDDIDACMEIKPQEILCPHCCSVEMSKASDHRTTGF